MLDLKLFGNFEIRGGPILGSTSNSKVRALLACLVISEPKGQTRDFLKALLWGSRFEKQADQSFRQALAQLKKIVGPDAISVTDQIIRLSPDHISADVTRFEDLARDGSKEALRQALFLADGPLLNGISIREAAWEEWLAVERRRLERLLIDASLKLAEVEYEDGDMPAAIRLAEGVTRLDSLQESAHRLIMHALARLGRRNEALNHYLALADRLKDELGTAPEPATVALYGEIKTGVPPALPKHSGGWQSEHVAGAPPSIAVLPFTNLSHDPEHGFFGDGIADDLITDLSRTGKLFVIARNSSFAYRATPADVHSIAHTLGVRFIVEGSARRAGERLRINVRLIDAETGQTVWAERFDRSLGDIFAVQDELVRHILERLLGRLVGTPHHERKRATSIDAYDFCVRGRGLVLRSPDATREARILFEQAIAIEPGYSEPHRWLALCYELAWTYGGEPEKHHHDLALTAARKAIALDPNDGAAHAVLGTILETSREWEEAGAELSTALRLDPNNADSWALFSELLVLKGQPADAIAAVEKALRLNPHPPGWYVWFLGQAQYLNGDYELAVETLTKEATYRTQSRRTLAASLAQLGRLDEARQEARLFIAGHPNFTISHWVHATPFESRAAGEHFVDGYRKAGLPE